MIEDIISNNGYEYIDLDLPSGTLWSTKNIGASKSDDSGLYFQWGDTKGYTADQVGKEFGQKKFTWDDYKYEKSSTKYTNPGTKLYLEDDAAHVNMRGSWHIPSPKQCQELISNTDCSWAISEDGVSGYLFISKKNESNYIFIPAAGNAWNGSIDDIGDYGYIWSSMLGTDYDDYGQSLYFISGRDYIVTAGLDRCYGFNIRGVIG